MSGNEFRGSRLRRESTRFGFDTDNKIFCNCGWELRLGYGVAVSLAIFEAKRFFLLALEIFVEWQIIRFAGGYRPVVLTIIDITLGFPCALAAVYTIRKRQVRASYAKSGKIFVYLLVTISACVILNILTMVSIGYHVSVRHRSIANVFNASMYLYVTTASYKYTIDQLQFALQCCGHTSYTDWFLFDWQLVDYAPRDEMSRQDRISDEIDRDRGVPFSCCKLRYSGPCEHSQMTEEDIVTVNVDGCSGILSNFLVRIVFVAYAMTTMLVMTQVLLAFFVARIVKKTRSRKKMNDRTKYNGDSSCRLVLEKSNSDVRCEEYYRRDKKCTGKEWNYETRSGKKKWRREDHDNGAGSGAVISGYSEISQDSLSPERPWINEKRRHRTARIKPSVHSEHRVPKKRSGMISRIS